MFVPCSWREWCDNDRLEKYTKTKSKLFIKQSYLQIYPNGWVSIGKENGEYIDYSFRVWRRK